MKKRNLLLISIVFVASIFLVVPFTKAIFKSISSSTETIDTAEWNVSLTQMSETNNVTLISGVDTQVYSLKVSSESEVNVVYAIEIGNVPAGVKIKLDDRQNYETPDANNKIVFSNAGSITYSLLGGENTHVLTFTSDPGTAVVSNRQLTVKVIAQQDI